MVDAYLRLLVDIPLPPSRKPSRSDTLLEPRSTDLRSTKGLWDMCWEDGSEVGIV